MFTVDAIKKSTETDQIPLQWVGMEKVTFPVFLNLSDVKTSLSCEFDIFVNLVNPSKGIHMSRVYDILNQYVRTTALSLSGLRDLLTKVVDSQQGISSQAKIVIHLSLPFSMATLKSGADYLKSVPLTIELTTAPGKVLNELKFQVDYSSTCPQSAALAHQLTLAEMRKLGSVTGNELILWYERNGFVATPHAQRSQAEISLQLGQNFEIGQFPELYMQVAECLGTPTQGLVKRVDEQEFSRLNAENLMFCEDAARKLILFFKKSPLILSGAGKINHLESLHSHNAVTYFNF